MFQKIAWLWGIIFLTGFSFSLPVEAGTEEGIVAYEEGDYETALYEFKSAAEAGDPEAQFRLGEMYQNGLGITGSFSETARWYRRAAEQGVVEAQNNLGTIYLFGLGVPVDYEEAIKWFRLAAGRGQANAQYQLGRMYEAGLGVSQDLVQAYKWDHIAYFTYSRDINSYTQNDFSLINIVISAKRQGRLDCLSGGMEKKMTSEQIAEAQKLAKEWMEKYQDNDKQ